MLKAVGMDDPGPLKEEAREIWRAAQSERLNLRQCMERVKGQALERRKIQRPEKIEEEAPEERNVYTGGALKNPISQRLAIAGFGAWWPGRGQDDTHILEDNKGVVHIEEQSGGLATWAPMRGAWASSTRSELAGLVVAMGTNIAIHVGIDNAAVVNKATRLIEKGEGL